MQITRTEKETGGPDRTRREDIVSLFTGPRGVEPEQYFDISASQGWEWLRTPGLCTFTVQLAAVKAFGEPFAVLDSQHGHEAASAGGVATYPFNNQYVPLSDKLDEDGDPIIDVNPANFDERMHYFMAMYPQLFRGGIPYAGGTEAMTAVRAGDEHFMDEFGGDPRDKRPIRGRVMWTDGLLNDAEAFRRYLSEAKPGSGPSQGLGVHGEWDEAWAVAILGEGPDADGNDAGKAAYQQYVNLAKDHPWIHPYYFQGVANGLEIAEDMAVAVVPTQA